MSIFNKVKKAKKAADQHNRASSVTPVETETPTAPYKHIPTHAAQDSLSCAPVSWSIEETRRKIAAAHEQKRINLSKKTIHSCDSGESSSSSRVRATKSGQSIDSIIAPQKHNAYPKRSPYHYNGPVAPPKNNHINQGANNVPVMHAPARRSHLTSAIANVGDGVQYAESSKNSQCSTASSQTLGMVAPVCTDSAGQSSETLKPECDQKPHQPSSLSLKTAVLDVACTSSRDVSAVSVTDFMTCDKLKADTRKTRTPPVIPTKAIKGHNWFGKRQQVVAH